MKAGFNYQVVEGDCISSIALKNGFTWQKVWDNNPDLKTLRQNPNVLFPGDVVKVPDQVERDESCATEIRHKFIKKGLLAKFRLVVENNNVALANRNYILTIDDKTFQGTTDGTGMLEVQIKPNAKTGRLQMPDDAIDCQLALGNLDPVKEINGVQQRLRNLGFLTTDPSGQMDDETKDALMNFQSSVDLTVTGELDDDTRNKLLLMHDEVHPQQEPQDQPPDAGSASSDAEDLQPDIDSQEDEAEMARLTSLDDE